MPAPWETPAAAAATVDGPPWEAQAERPPWESEPAAAELPSLKDEVASG